MGKKIIGICFALLSLIDLIYAQAQDEEFKEPYIQYLNAVFKHATYKKTQKGKKAGEVDFLKAKITAGGSEYGLDNRYYLRDDEAEEESHIFTSDIILRRNKLVIQGTAKQHFYFAYPIEDPDDFLYRVETADMKNMSTLISNSSFKLQGDLLELKSPELSFHWDNFNFNCAKNPDKRMKTHEAELDFLINSCWSNKLDISPLDKKLHSQLDFDYFFNQKEFHFKTQVKNFHSNVHEERISLDLRFIDTNLQDMFSLKSQRLQFNCQHPLVDDFDFNAIRKDCLNSFNFYTDGTHAQYFFKEEVEKTKLEIIREVLVDGIKEEDVKKTHIIDKEMDIDLSATELQVGKTKIISKIKDLQIVDKKFFQSSLSNLNLECERNRAFVNLDPFVITNVCLNNSFIQKNKETEQRENNIFYSFTIPSSSFLKKDSVIETKIDLKNVITQPEQAEFNLNFFELVYTGDDFQYDILFPNPVLKCKRDRMRFTPTDIHLLEQCLDTNEVKTQAGLIDANDDDFKFYFKPVTLTSGRFQSHLKKDRLTAYTKAMQYISKDLHANILDLMLDCKELNGKMGQSTEEIIEGCLKDALITSSRIQYVDHPKWSEKNLRNKNKKIFLELFENYRKEFFEGKDPFRYDDIENKNNWTAKDIKLTFDKGETKLGAIARIPLLGKFKVDIKGKSHFEIDEKEREWIVLRLSDVKVRNARKKKGGLKIKGLLVEILKSMLPESLFEVNKRCHDDKSDEEVKCYEIKIKVN